MIKRICVDNFRCLTNFEIELPESCILLGANGTGKSAVFDVLRTIQKLVVQKARLDDVFSREDLSALQASSTQSFVLEMTAAGREYRYDLVIEHHQERNKMRIGREKLICDGRPLFIFERGEAQLYRDDDSQGPSYPFDWSQSGVGYLYERADNKKLSRFKKELANIFVLRPCPPVFEPETRTEDEFLEMSMRNFVGWYRHTAQENMGGLARMFIELAQVLPGFESLSLAESGESTRALRAVFSTANSGRNTRKYGFSMLSDGQRALIALYSLLFLPEDRKPSLFMDEPDNYLALGEVRPWLMRASDALGESLEQVVVISHHPITVDYLGAGQVKWFSREQEGPVRVSDEPEASNSALALSELIARGWDR